MTLAEFIIGAEAYYVDSHDERRGQAYFNYLFEVNQRMATDICGSRVDPFYDDAIIPQFLVRLATLGFR